MTKLLRLVWVGLFFASSIGLGWGFSQPPKKFSKAMEASQWRLYTKRIDHEALYKPAFGLRFGESSSRYVALYALPRLYYLKSLFGLEGSPMFDVLKSNPTIKKRHALLMEAIEGFLDVYKAEVPSKKRFEKSMKLHERYMKGRRALGVVYFTIPEPRGHRGNVD